MRDVPAVELGAIAIREALRRATLDPAVVDYVLMGMVVQAGAGQVPSRQASLRAGLPEGVPSDTINKVCASALRAVNVGDALIRAGDVEVVVAGGMENMSQAPYLVAGARWGQRMGHGRLVDAMILDGLWCPFGDCHMGSYGDRGAREFSITREEQDAWAYSSQQRAARAAEEGKFRVEIVPVEVPRPKGPPLVLERDEHPRPDTTLEKLATLAPVFEKGGTVTAGNAPGINDGATALVLMSAERAGRLGLHPLARIVSQGQASSHPSNLHAVPALAGQKALAAAGLKVGDLALIEVNEAFAAVALASTKLGGWDPEKVNVNGGAIALGHPIGATGGRLLMTLIFELQRRGGGYGLATLCSGGGQGEATLVEVPAS